METVNPTQTTPPSPSSSIGYSSPEEPKKKFPIWLIVVPLVLIAVAGVTNFAFFFGKGHSSESPAPTPIAAPEASESSPSSGFGALTQQTTDETAEWTTYTNTRVGFELRYPERYSRPELPSGGPSSQPVFATGSEDNTDIIFGQNSSDSVDLIIFPFSDTLDELKNYTESPVSLPLYETAALVRDIQVGGTMGQWYEVTPRTVYSDDPNSGAIRVYFIGRNHGFILNTTLGHSEEEITQILSTFKFTE